MNGGPVRGYLDTDTQRRKTTGRQRKKMGVYMLNQDFYI
jgi:hypothetical protein